MYSVRIWPFHFYQALREGPAGVNERTGVSVYYLQILLRKVIYNWTECTQVSRSVQIPAQIKTISGNAIKKLNYFSSIVISRDIIFQNLSISAAELGWIFQKSALEGNRLFSLPNYSKYAFKIVTFQKFTKILPKNSQKVPEGSSLELFRNVFVGFCYENCALLTFLTFPFCERDASTQYSGWIHLCLTKTLPQKHTLSARKWSKSAFSAEPKIDVPSCEPLWATNEGVPESRFLELIGNEFIRDRAELRFCTLLCNRSVVGLCSSLIGWKSSGESVCPEIWFVWFGPLVSVAFVEHVTGLPSIIGFTIDMGRASFLRWEAASGTGDCLLFPGSCWSLCCCCLPLPEELASACFCCRFSSRFCNSSATSQVISKLHWFPVDKVSFPRH